MTGQYPPQDRPSAPTPPQPSPSLQQPPPPPPPAPTPARALSAASMGITSRASSATASTALSHAQTNQNRPGSSNTNTNTNSGSGADPQERGTCISCLRDHSLNAEKECDVNDMCPCSRCVRFSIPCQRVPPGHGLVATLREFAATISRMEDAQRPGGIPNSALEYLIGLKDVVTTALSTQSERDVRILHLQKQVEALTRDPGGGAGAGDGGSGSGGGIRVKAEEAEEDQDNDNVDNMSRDRAKRRRLDQDGQFAQFRRELEDKARASDELQRKLGESNEEILGLTNRAVAAEQQASRFESDLRAKNALVETLRDERQRDKEDERARAEEQRRARDDLEARLVRGHEEELGRLVAMHEAEKTRNDALRARVAELTEQRDAAARPHRDGRVVERLPVNLQRRVMSIALASLPSLRGYYGFRTEGTGGVADVIDKLRVQRTVKGWYVSNLLSMTDSDRREFEQMRLVSRRWRTELKRMLTVLRRPRTFKMTPRGIIVAQFILNGQTRLRDSSVPETKPEIDPTPGSDPRDDRSSTINPSETPAADDEGNISDGGDRSDASSALSSIVVSSMHVDYDDEDENLSDLRR